MKKNILLVFVLIVVAVAGVFSVKAWRINVENETLKENNKQLEEALKNTGDSLARVEDEKNTLTEALDVERQKNSNYSTKIDEITNTVEKFERLSKIDPELLQKYSKVYFLNENYVPSELTNIDTKFLSNKDKPLQIHDRVWPFLRDLLSNANTNGINLRVASAYRSFGTQASLKSNYKVTYGAGTANQFSADQGYSEHQLGAAVDFTTTEMNGGLDGFQKTSAYSWLNENAYKYGFILSYPSGNAYYVFEPWHWRLVGIDLATTLRNQNKRFYDLDQREISTFLGTLFNSTTTVQVNN